MKYRLPTDFGNIKAHSLNSWKATIALVVDEKNRERLKTECHKTENGVQKPRSKTSSIAKKISEQSYVRRPDEELLHMTKHETKTIIIGRYGMLECGKNFKGTLKPHCEKCNLEDDENHRLNYCYIWQERNLYHSEEKINFDLIYSRDIDTLRLLVSKINMVWNTQNAHGTMRNE